MARLSTGNLYRHNQNIRTLVFAVYNEHYWEFHEENELFIAYTFSLWLHSGLI